MSVVKICWIFIKKYFLKINFRKYVKSILLTN